jgi:CheY-like chemotaxis protein
VSLEVGELRADESLLLLLVLLLLLIIEESSAAEVPRHARAGILAHGDHIVQRQPRQRVERHLDSASRRHRTSTGPYRPALAHPERYGQCRLSGGRTGKPDYLDWAMANLLLVDDDAETPDLLSEMLRFDGHDTRVARIGWQRLTLLHARQPEVAGLDVETPNVSAPEMAREMVVLDHGLENVSIISCSRIPNLDRVTARVGTRDFLTGPCALDALMHLIDPALDERASPLPPSVPSEKH